ncbi:hypothetical protein UPYG_G00159830 [Umbra pygmaea]|uniref:Tubulin polyglutamylase TTLL4 n=1 Tax=Umbra pygmaea TaxID=75934 RepID=A0ABD0X333_UMBPY
MAFNGAQDGWKTSNRASTFTSRAKTAVCLVNGLNVTPVSSPIPEKPFRSLACVPPVYSDSVSGLNVREGHTHKQQLHGVSGSQQRAYLSVPTANIIDKPQYPSNAGYNSTNSHTNGSCKPSVQSFERKSKQLSISDSACLVALEPLVHSYRPSWNFESLRLNSQILARKRALPPQPAGYATSPSPPKAERSPGPRQNEMAPQRAAGSATSMSTKQSVPWTTGTLRDNSRGGLRPTTGKVPSRPRQETVQTRDSAEPLSLLTHSVSYRCGADNGDKPHPHNTVPLTARSPYCCDVTLEHVWMLQDQRPFESLVVADMDAADEYLRLGCFPASLGAPRASGNLQGEGTHPASSKVEFTQAVRKLTQSGRAVTEFAIRSRNGTITSRTTALPGFRVSPVKLVRAPTARPSSYPGCHSSAPAKPLLPLCLTKKDQALEPSNGVSTAVAMETTHASTLNNKTTNCTKAFRCMALPPHSPNRVSARPTSAGATAETLEAISEPTPGCQSPRPSVITVTTQISAIDLSKERSFLHLEKDPHSPPPPLDKKKALAPGSPELCSPESVTMEEPGRGEAEFTDDDLDEDCSDEDDDDGDGSDCSSMNDALSTASMTDALSTASMNDALSTASMTDALSTASMTDALSTASMTDALSTASMTDALSTASMTDALSTASMNDALSTAFGPVPSDVADEERMSPEQEDEKELKPALIPSIFPLRPPTLYFSTANERVEPLPADQRKLLRWKMSTVTPNVVKHTIARSHFKATKRSHDWLGCWGHHMKSPGFKAIREYQKLNHFPGSFQIGRKDRLWRNLSKMQAQFGKREFGFFPRSFVLPQDIKLLRKAWDDSGNRQKWIIKPPASARGIGIQVIHKWSQMPRKRPLLVQKYLHKPYLISGNKFDLRIYVYVTSYDPLRVYIFQDGLVRFASCKYSSSMKSLGNKFMHLTNYSVNKKNSEYQSNDSDKACQGHKWALKALWHYLGSKGVNTTLIWEKIKDMVIKTIIASDPYVNTLVKMHLRSPYSCHELFGFDIMLDENLKPWVLEVNISPSLHSNTALDVAIKGQMIRDVLNLAGFVLPQIEEVLSSSSSASSLYGGTRERSRLDISIDEKVKRAFYLNQRFADQVHSCCLQKYQGTPREFPRQEVELFSTILDVMTPEDVRVLADTEDELNRKGEFERVFPSQCSSRYLRFFEQPRYLNILLNEWETKFGQDRSKGISMLKTLCQKGVHLGTDDPAHMWSRPVFAPSSKQETSSVVISPEKPQPDQEEYCLDRELQSVTASLPDISLLGSVTTTPTPSLASQGSATLLPRHSV